MVYNTKFLNEVLLKFSEKLQFSTIRLNYTKRPNHCIQTNLLRRLNLSTFIHEAKYSLFPILKFILFVFLVQFETFDYFPMNLLVY
jgi:hypothetical protein